jgi:mitogen-activated protein kinase kinase kinase 13
LVNKRHDEWKHAKDIRIMYERKLEKTNQLYDELYAFFSQLEERERDIAEREKKLGRSASFLRKQNFEKLSRRRYLQVQFVPMNQQNSPASPVKTADLVVNVDGSETKSVLQPAAKFKKSKHRRVGSGSLNVKALAKKDIETQTDMNDLNDEIATTSEKMQKSADTLNSYNDDESDIDNDNVDETSSSQNNNNNQVMGNSMATSIGTSIMTGSNFSDVNEDSEDMCENERTQSDDDNLEDLRKKVNELIIETSSNIQSFCSTSTTNNSVSTVINRSPRDNDTQQQNVDGNENFIAKTNDDSDYIKDASDVSDDDENRNTDDDDLVGKKFNYSTRMKR